MPALRHPPPWSITRRHPPPWSIEDTGTTFVVKDSGGQKLGLFITKRSRGRNS
jgi:hypothetical protein